MIFNRERIRIVYLFLTIAVIIMGFLSRLFADVLPQFLAAYSGDTLWGLMVFLAFGVIFKKKSTKFVAIVAVIFAYSVEFSQLLTNPQLNELRETTFGGLVLGHVFLLSDLVCYSIGILIGVLMECGYIRAVTKK